MPRHNIARLEPRSRLAFGTLRALDRVGLSRPCLRAMLGFFPRAYARMGRSLHGYEPTERDVFVAVYPKAGNNWMMQLATQVVHRGEVEFDHIHDLVAWPQAPVPELIVPLDAPTHLRCVTGRRVIKTQLPHPQTPYSERAHYMVVLRDPKDTLVSMYHFANGIIGGIVDVQFSMEALYEYVVSDTMPACWAEHAASWWALRERDNVFVVTFDEMKRDLAGVVSSMAAVLGVELSEAEHARVVERGSFAWMKAHEDKFAPPVPTYRGEPATMIRKGEVGGSKAALSPAQRAALDDHYRRKLAALGSDLPYDELFAASSTTAN